MNYLDVQLEEPQAKVAFVRRGLAQQIISYISCRDDVEASIMAIDIAVKMNADASCNFPDGRGFIVNPHGDVFFID